MNKMNDLNVMELLYRRTQPTLNLLGVKIFVLQMYETKQLLIQVN